MSMKFMIDIATKLLLTMITPVLITGCDNSPISLTSDSVMHSLDLTEYSAEKPTNHLNLLFIHHSCGATWLADAGEKVGEYCLYQTHPNGGGLRRLLQQNNYNVHEATYGSQIGQDTDINHWPAKFRDQMDLILKIRHQDDVLSADEVNQIVVFKSCYPNNTIIADGLPPGTPDSPERTIWNCKAAYNSLLPIFKKYPNTLFVAVTAPPTVKPWINKYKEFILNLLGKGPENIGMRARLFNNWLVNTKSGWLASYELKNVVVFDYYNILTDDGKSNWTQYPTRDGKDSHPSAGGNSIASEKFIIFLNKAVNYAGLKGNE